MTDYSAGLTSQLFWLQEARKTAALISEGKDKAAIKEVAWEDNIFADKALQRWVPERKPLLKGL